MKPLIFFQFQRLKKQSSAATIFQKLNHKIHFLPNSQCKNSQWDCTQRECPATCSAYGDPHYMTFDGNKYEFHGDCTYVLAEDFCDDGIGNFRITVENVPCSTGGVTCTKAVKV